MKELQELHQHVQAEAEAIPPAERLQQKQKKDGKFSLTSSALFWKNHQTPHKLVVILCSHFECEVVGERGMRAHVLIKLLLRSFARMYSLWREKEYLTPTQVAQAQAHARQFGECWSALGWKPTPWAHWAACHNGKILGMYRSLYLFSSIPIEYRNRTFKVRLKNSMRGWCLKKPRVTMYPS